MKKMPRLLIALALILGIIALTGNQTARADTVGTDPSELVVGQGQNSLLYASSHKGSVVPPPSSAVVCSPNDVPDMYSIGGVAVLHLDELEPGYCIEVFLGNYLAPHWLPENAGDFLSHIVYVRIYKHGELIDKAPSKNGDIYLCFALPPDKDGELYFYDYYGARFFDRPGQPAWVLNMSTNENGIVCTDDITIIDENGDEFIYMLATGAYALVGE